MKRLNSYFSGFFFLSLLFTNILFAESDQQSDKPIYAVVGGQKHNYSTPFPDDDDGRRILAQTELERQGWNLANQGLYDEAQKKYREALNPSFFKYEYEKATSIGAIVQIYKRQGKFEDALREYQWFIDQNKMNDAAKESQKELLALLESQKTGSPKPVYEHSAYLRNRYKKYIPPQSKGDSGFHLGPINDIIHLYNWMGDADGGIKFMNEVLSSKSLYPAERKEYERVKAAFEEDKRTGQKGHLQKVIETSDYIGW